MKQLSWVKDVKGQLEKGEEGTTHIQGYLHTNQVRFSMVKKALSRAHIEPARNTLALQQYVQKEDTRVAEIPVAKVATQKEVQNEVLEILKLNSEKFENPSYFLWCLQEGVEFSNANNTQLCKEAEWWVDQAVRSLILKGYYGVEFVMSNPQVRFAFKRYLPQILLRQINAEKQKINLPEATV